MRYPRRFSAVRAVRALSLTVRRTTSTNTKGTTTMSRPRTLISAVLLGVVLPIIVSSAPASAKLIERGEFHEVFTGVIDDFCDVPGFTVSFEIVADGAYSLTSRGRDGLVYFMDHTTSWQTTTNLDNGLSVVDKTRVVDKDLHVTDNGDGTLTIVILLTGPRPCTGLTARPSPATRARSVSSSSSTTPAHPPIPPTTWS